jgi:predicted DNA-binding transcriptional regulator YafY
MTSDRLERLLKLIQTLESGRTYRVEELAELVGVTRRTVFRDLKFLTRAGIDYAYDRDTGRYRKDRTTVLPPVALSPAEALGLLLATRTTLASGVLPDPPAAAAAAIKIESVLPRTILDYCGPLLEHVEVKYSPVSDPQSVLDCLSTLQAALAARRKVWVRYDSYYEGRTIERVLQLYRLAYIHRGWYAIAFSEHELKPLTFKLERIIELKVLDATYEIDEDFSLDDYFKNAWLLIPGDKRYHLKVRFHKQVAGNVEEVAWHKTQKTYYEEDGSLIFEADVDGIEEVSWWVLGYGDMAEVHEPPELISLIAERVRRMNTYYNNGSAAATA